MKIASRMFAFAIALVLTTAGQSFAQKPPEGKIDINPNLPWSERMALSEIYRHQQELLPNGNTDSPTFSNSKGWGYVHGLVLTSIQEVWEHSGKDIYWDYTASYGDTMVREDGTIEDYDVHEYNIDHINAGNVLFPIYEKTGEARYKKALDLVRSQLDNHPRTQTGGFWHKEIYVNQMWLDGLYMGQPFYAHYSTKFNDGKELDDVARQFIIMDRQARDYDTGLLYHGWDSKALMYWADPITGLSKEFWGRAVGWYAMGLVDALDFFPEDHPRRAELISILQNLCDAMAKVQDPSGVWWQVLTHPNREGNYKEATVTSMMTYSVLKGIRKGYLDLSYLNMAEKSWNGMHNEFITVDPDDNEVHLNQCCAVSGLGGRVRMDGPSGEIVTANKYGSRPEGGVFPDREGDRRRDGTFDYYISEPIRANDGKGTGPFIRAALEVETMSEWLPAQAKAHAERFALK